MQTRASRFTILLVLLGCVASLTTVASASAASPAAPAPQNGPWKGVYFVYPNLMALELDLGFSPGGAVSGILKFYPAVNQRSAFGQPKPGSYQVSGQYDDSSRSVLLKPGAWIEKTDMAGAVAPLAGVFDAKSAQLAGVFEFPAAATPVFFVLAPGAAGDRLVADITRAAYPPPPTREQELEKVHDNARANFQRVIEQMKKMPQTPATEAQIKRMEEQMEKQFATLPGAAGAADRWTAPSGSRLLEWVSRLKREVPALDLGRTVLNKIYVHALLLFEDAYFKQYFGLTYEEMDTAERKTVAKAFYDNARELSGYDFMSRPFQNAGDFGAPDVTVSIHWQQVLRSWLRGRPDTFAALPAEVDSFSRLAVAESAGNSVLPYLWPAEAERFNTALAGARTRLAEPVLTLHADQLIASATGNAGARDLAAWQTREKDILPYASPAGRERLQQRIDARLDELLRQLLAVNLRSLATLGRGLAAVQAGNQWYQQVEQSFGFVLTRPPVQEAVREFRQARARHLTEAEPAIIAEIDTAVDAAQVQAVLHTYLRCPGDAVSSSVRQHVSQRLATIKHEELMGLFSDYEKSLMDPPESGHLDIDRADKLHIPQPDELRLALVRGLAYGTGKVLGPHTAKISTLLGGGSMIVTISDTTHGRYVYIKNRDSWMVLYKVDMQFSLPDHDPLWDADPNLRKGAQLAVDMANTTAALLAKEDNIQEFRLYDDGWGVPNLREEGAGRAGIDALLRGMMKNP